MTGDELTAWMREHGYSNALLAEAIGVTRNSVIRWRQGVHPVPRMVEVALGSLPDQPEPLDQRRARERREAEA